MQVLVHLILSALILAFAPAVGSAQTSEARETQDAIVHAYSHATVGPATIRLRDLATLDLPKDFAFVPASASKRLLHGMGNAANGTVLGMVIPASHYDGWFITLAINETGHVSNAALALLDDGDIRSAIASATRRGNAARMQSGSSPLDAGGLLEPSSHDPVSHGFTTAIRIYETGPTSGGEDSINLESYAFGRNAALQISLVDSISDYAKHRPAFDGVVAGVAFAVGQRAIDFVPGRDREATHLLDVVFGGRTVSELAAETAEDAAEADRLAKLPPARSMAAQLKLAFFGVLGLLAVLAGVVAFNWRSSEVPRSATRDVTVERALRSSRR